MTAPPKPVSYLLSFSVSGACQAPTPEEATPCRPPGPVSFKGPAWSRSWNPAPSGTFQVGKEGR